MKKHARIYYLLIVLVCTSLVLIGVEAWDYWSEDYERSCVKEQLPSLDANWNIKTIAALQQRLQGRSSFRFAVFADVHQNFGRFERILACAQRYAPDFIFIAGDLTNEGLFYEYRRVLTALQECPIPVLVCPGNHDVRNYGSRCYSHILGPLNYYFDLNSTRFIVLNNVTRDVSNDLAALPAAQHTARLGRGIDGPMLTELRVQLQQQTRSFVVMHIPPPVPPFDFYSFSRNGDEFVDLCSAAADRIAAVFFGHIHGYGETIHNGVRYIEAGGAGSPRDINRNRDGIDTRTNFVLVDVTPDGEQYRPVFVE